MLLKGKSALLRLVRLLLIVYMLNITFFDICIFAQNANQQKQQEAIITEALNNVNMAIKLVTEAQKVLNTEITQESMSIAYEMYLKAGQLFENSESVFIALGPQYIPKEYVENCSKYKNSCIQALMKLKKEMK